MYINENSNNAMSYFLAYVSKYNNSAMSYVLAFVSKAVSRGDKRTRRVRDRVFVKFERSRRYRDRYRCQEKKSRRGRARDPVFRDHPTPRTSSRSLFAARDSPPHGLRLKPWI
jgi:hypothetical protein